MFSQTTNFVTRSTLLLAALLAGGCGQDAVKVYTVPKETPPAMAAPPAAAPQIKWTTPTGWQEQPASQMRVASFKVTGPDGKQADISVIPLGGGAGSDFSNVNRWRGQIGLEPVTEDEVKNFAEPVAVAGQPAALYDLAGEANRILAVIQRRGDTAWFFKLTGDKDLAAQQKPAFIAFLKSFQFAAAAEAPARTAGTPQWTAPADWQPVPAGQFLVAKFQLTGATVNISTSTGDGGGLSANVNRWRKQLGLPEATPEELTKSVQQLTTTTGNAMLVELQGEKAQLVGAIVLQPGQAWFYKLMGDAAVVTTQKVAFIKFVQGVKY